MNVESSVIILGKAARVDYLGEVVHHFHGDSLPRVAHVDLEAVRVFILTGRRPEEGLEPKAEGIMNAADKTGKLMEPEPIEVVHVQVLHPELDEVFVSGHELDRKGSIEVFHLCQRCQGDEEIHAVGDFGRHRLIGKCNEGICVA